MAAWEVQVIVSETCWALDRLICLVLHRFLAGAAHLCYLTVHLLHHSHLQAQLGENDRGGMLLANNQDHARLIGCLRKTDRICFTSTAETNLANFSYYLLSV